MEIRDVIESLRERCLLLERRVAGLESIVDTLSGFTWNLLRMLEAQEQVEITFTADFSADEQEALREDTLF